MRHVAGGEHAGQARALQVVHLDAAARQQRQSQLLGEGRPLHQLRRDEDAGDVERACLDQRDAHPVRPGGQALDRLADDLDAAGRQVVDEPVVGPRAVGEDEHAAGEGRHEQRHVPRLRAAAEHGDRAAPHLVAVAERAVRHAGPPQLGQPRHVGQHVAQAGGEHDRIRVQRFAGVDDERIPVGAQVGRGAVEQRDPRVAGEVAPGPLPVLGRRYAVGPGVVVHVRRRGVAVGAGVEDGHGPTDAGDGEGGLQPGGAASEDEDI